MNNSMYPKIAFFGTPDRAVFALNILKKRGIRPDLILTQPDRPQGRKLILTPPPVKEWAEKEGIPCIQPETLDQKTIEILKSENFDLFIVVAYGKILKKEVLSIPRKGAINLHASLLPELRGSCPIETAILEDNSETGVSIILMDELMTGKDQDIALATAGRRCGKNISGKRCGAYV
jgi:methionyl-tRNA formyltransferase